MTTKLNIYIFFGLILFTTTWLFVGLFRDEEFFEPELFLKYRPTFKINFYPSVVGGGEYGQNTKKLSTEEQLEEKYFQDFVIKQNQQYNSYPKLWFLPLVLIQMTLTCFTLGIYKFRNALNYKFWQPPIHFLVNFLTTSLILAFVLAFDKLAITMLLTFTFVAINYASIIWLTKQKGKFKTSKPLMTV